MPVLNRCAKAPSAQGGCSGSVPAITCVLRQSGEVAEPGGEVGTQAGQAAEQSGEQSGEDTEPTGDVGGEGVLGCPWPSAPVGRCAGLSRSAASGFDQVQGRAGFGGELGQPWDAGTRRR